MVWLALRIQSMGTRECNGECTKSHREIQKVPEKTKLIGSSRLHTASTAKRYVYNLKSTLSHPMANGETQKKFTKQNKRNPGPKPLRNDTDKPPLHLRIEGETLQV
jgi:hypothetical protein